MKKLVFVFLLITLVFAATDLAQSKSRKTVRKTKSKTVSNASRKAVYYISVGRSNAGQYSKKQWGRVAATLKRNGIPAFFAEHHSLPLSEQIRGEWLLVRIVKRLSNPAADALFLGPFDSETAARKAVNKFSKLFSDEGNPLNENYAGEWSMGNYLIMGVHTR